ncbi:Uncharacterised protein [Mycobacteroides abscessus subsp. bolletii]|uniref:hypothetical protein n=1 Tax=Mycobacteroides abscessus TaxID=36809 RepID=UPI0009A824BA|nr:hypothetical protein [Mycobacteroides abscessus]SKY22478.1 Uncharacterised protein [Mycobacteroides abscessus subsp. bolletii]
MGDSGQQAQERGRLSEWSLQRQAKAWEAVRAARAAMPKWAWPEVDLETLPPPGAIEHDPVGPPPKFQRLHQWFTEQRDEQLEVPKELFNELIDGGLPSGATTGKCSEEWWTNNPSKRQCRAWVNAGYLFTGECRAGARIFVRRPRPVQTRAQIVSQRMYWLRHLQVCPTSTHDREPHDRPTSVYIIHLNDVGLYKVGVSATLERRMHDHAAGGRRHTIVQTLALQHRSCAYALEAVVLNLTEQWRTFDDPWRCPGGYSETWSDDGLVPDLQHLAELMNGELAVGVPDPATS